LPSSARAPARVVPPARGWLQRGVCRRAVGDRYVCDESLIERISDPLTHRVHDSYVASPAVMRCALPTVRPAAKPRSACRLVVLAPRPRLCAAVLAPPPGD